MLCLGEEHSVFVTTLVLVVITVLFFVARRLCKRRSEQTCEAEEQLFYTPLSDPDGPEACDPLSGNRHSMHITYDGLRRVPHLALSQQRCWEHLRAGHCVVALRAYAGCLSKLSAEMFRPLLAALFAVDEDTELLGASALALQSGSWALTSCRLLDSVPDTPVPLGAPGSALWRIGVQHVGRGSRVLVSRFGSRFGFPPPLCLIEAGFKLLQPEARSWHIPSTSSALGTFWNTTDVTHGDDGSWSTLSIRWNWAHLRTHYPSLVYMFKLLTLSLHLGDTPLYLLTPARGARLTWRRPAGRPSCGVWYFDGSVSLKWAAGLACLTLGYHLEVDWTVPSALVLRLTSSDAQLSGLLGPLLRRAIAVRQVRVSWSLVDDADGESDGASYPGIFCDIDAQVWVSAFVDAVARMMLRRQWIDDWLGGVSDLLKLYSIVLNGIADDIG